MILLSTLTFLASFTALFISLWFFRQLRSLLVVKDEPRSLIKRLKLHHVRQLELKNAIDYILSTHDVLQSQSKQSFQKFGLIRFNPYRNTGGDQSFALCLLNRLDKGIIITAIHGREGTRIYAKTVNHKGSDYELSSEEQQALNQALQS